MSTSNQSIPKTYTVFKGSSVGVILKEEIEIPELHHDEVLVRITHSGVCATDELFRSEHVAMGHEGAGHVIALGPNAKSLKLNDAVAWGLQHNSCNHCSLCLSGKDNYCPLRRLQGFHDTNLGSMATHTVIAESFLFKVPHGMRLEHAAPLICAGSTVFGPMSIYNLRPGQRVGVIGFGGLGHLAVQFAAKMGCRVVVFSGSPGKEHEARSFGAEKVYVTKGKGENQGDVEKDIEREKFVAKVLGRNSETRGEEGEDVVEELEKRIDHLFVTSSVLVDWGLYLDIMSPGGTIYLLTASPGSDLVMPYTPIVRQGLRIQGSLIAPRHAVREMLEFAMQHDIRPVVQEWPMSIEGITEAMEALKHGTVRYRAVLVNQP